MIDRTTQYALDVINGVYDGKIGKSEIKACQRHLDDIEQSKTAPYKYYFDIEEAERIIDFAETLVIAEGDEEKKVKCEPFQCFILGSLNGWRTKEGSYRKYRKSYIQLARQQGKTFINGILAAYYGNFSNYKYGQIYLTATKTEQAAICFKEIVKFIRSDEELSELFDIHEHNHTIDCLITKSTIKGLSGDTKSIDGFRPFMAVVDEYHAHPNNQMYKLLEGGTKKLKSCLISVITTAGFNVKGPCYELYKQCKKIIDKVFTDETQFVFICELDESDDPFLPDNWYKANPLSRSDKDFIEIMLPVANTAKEMGGFELRDFFVKQLNLWIQVGNLTYISDISAWNRCGSDRTLEDFKGYRAYVGIDLSSGGDLTSIAIVIPFYQEEQKKYYVWSKSYIPAQRLQEHIETDDMPYDIWEKQGLLTATETMQGIKTDYKYIIVDLAKIIEEYDLDIKMICYDPHNASTFLGDLQDLGCDCLCITQTSKHLNDPTVDFRLEIMAGNVEFNKDNQLLTTSIANATVISNPKYKEITISKDVNTDRIDPIDAVIDAWHEAMKDDQEVDQTEVMNSYLGFLEKAGY